MTKVQEMNVPVVFYSDYSSLSDNMSCLPWADHVTLIVSR